MSASDHLRSSSRLLLATGISPHLELRAQCREREAGALHNSSLAIAKKPAVSEAKRSQTLICPSCYVPWVPALTCKIRIYAYQSQHIKIPTHGKNKRARQRAARSVARQHETFTRKLASKKGAAFQEKAPRDLRYMHYNCLRCSGFKSIPVPLSPPVQPADRVNPSPGAGTTTTTTSKLATTPTPKQSETKPKPKIGGLSLTDFLL